MASNIPPVLPYSNRPHDVDLHGLPISGTGVRMQSLSFAVSLSSRSYR